MVSAHLRAVVAVVLLAGAFLASACTGGPGAQSFCDSLRKGPNPLDVFNSYDPSDAAGAHATLQQGVDRLTQLGAVAPTELRSAMGTLIDVARQITDALEQRASNPTSASVPDFSKRVDEITQASAAVTAFASSRCGVTLDPSVTTVTTAAPPSSS